MEKLKVLIVDSSVYYKKILSQVVEKTGLGQVEHTASNGLLALERLRQSHIDVVLLDLFTPETRGLEILEDIRLKHPEVFVILFGTAGLNRDYLKRALQKGVLDFIVKPSISDAERDIEKIKNQLQGLFTQMMTQKYISRGANGAAFGEPSKSAPGRCPPSTVRQPARKKTLKGIDLVVIASSTGGPTALERLFRDLPATFNKPILVVQHMPAELTKKLAHSLAKKCKLSVLEAEEGDSVKAGQVMIAPGGSHMTLQQKNNTWIIRLEDSAPVHGVKPAADVLFHSVADTCRGKQILAIVLTGMGSDGMLGVKEMKKTCECYCITQSEKTCVVYGMPKSVVEAGLSDEVANLDMITSRVLQMASGRSHSQ